MRRKALLAAAAGPLAALALLSGCAGNPAPAMESSPGTATPRAAAARPTADALSDAGVKSLLPSLTNAASPLPGIVTGGQIDSAGLGALAREGVRTVLDLRASDEPRGFDEPRVARAAGLEYVSLPVTHAGPDDAAFGRFREILGDGGRAPFLVHCASGNRVGAMMIPHLVLDLGMPADSAVTVAKRVGLKSDALLQQALDYVARHPATVGGTAPKR